MQEFISFTMKFNEHRRKECARIAATDNVHVQDDVPDPQSTEDVVVDAEVTSIASPPEVEPTLALPNQTQYSGPQLNLSLDDMINLTV